MNNSLFSTIKNKNNLILGDSYEFISETKEKFDLLVTSPPYNLGKEYEEKKDLEIYLKWLEKYVTKFSRIIKDTGSVCWQVGNYVEKNAIFPIDILTHELFTKQGFKLKNRIIWTYGHGLHASKRFSGRYEVIMWYTKTEDYKFNLDPIRVPVKYPNKKSYKGPNKGKLSSNPLGKNPSDIWDIPNVKSNHIEKTEHPCQFPIGLIEKLVIGLTDQNDSVIDPFMGVGSAAIASLMHGRNFTGIEIDKKYYEIAKQRIKDLEQGNLKYRPHDKPIFDPKC